jgi:hypothetical protein
MRFIVSILPQIATTAAGGKAQPCPLGRAGLFGRWGFLSTDGAEHALIDRIRNGVFAAVTAGETTIGFYFGQHLISTHSKQNLAISAGKMCKGSFCSGTLRLDVALEHLTTRNTNYVHACLSEL